MAAELDWVDAVSAAVFGDQADDGNGSVAAPRSSQLHSLHLVTVLHRMVVPHSGLRAQLPNVSLWYTVAVMGLCHLLAHKGFWKRLAPRLPSPVMGLGYAVLLTLALVLAPDAGTAFIYFQF